MADTVTRQTTESIELETLGNGEFSLGGYDPLSPENVFWNNAGKGERVAKRYSVISIVYGVILLPLIPLAVMMFIGGGVLSRGIDSGRHICGVCHIISGCLFAVTSLLLTVVGLVANFALGPFIAAGITGALAAVSLISAGRCLKSKLLRDYCKYKELKKNGKLK